MPDNGSANSRQPGGDHYNKFGDLQHWDVAAHFGFDYFQGAITKYLFRWRDKGGLLDLEKAAHYLQKYIEVERAKGSATPPTDPNVCPLPPIGWRCMREVGHWGPCAAVPVPRPTAGGPPCPRCGHTDYELVQSPVGDGRKCATCGYKEAY